jgi:hypothetical protein
MLRNLYIRTPDEALGLAIFLAIAAPMATAQTETPGTSPALHSITGVVHEAVSGRPVPGAAVRTVTHATIIDGVLGETPDSTEISATTDAEGRYALTGLLAGRYVVTVEANRRFLAKEVTIAGGASDESIAFDVPAAASIAGRVEDGHGEPVPQAPVFLFSKEYHGGALRLVVKDRATTNDAGEYEFHSVEPDHAWFIMAEKEGPQKSPISPVPSDVKARRPSLVATWFPGAPDADGAAPVMIKEARSIEHVDIRMVQSPNLCVEGTLEAGGQPAPLTFFIDEEGVSNYVHMAGHTGSDGKFRVCGLFPGAYRLSAAHVPSFQKSEPPSFGSVAVVLGKTDLNGIRLMVQPGVPTVGKAVFDGATPENTPAGKVSIYLEPLGRYSFVGENPTQSSSVPGEFSLTGILLDDYVLHAYCSGSGLYVKDVTYAGSSVLREPLRASRINPGAEFRVICGADGASFDATVADKDGKGIPDRHVIAVPTDVDSQSQLATALVTCQTDQNGQCTLSGLAPGKYHVLATADGIDMTPEALADLALALQSKASEIELGASQHSAVTLTAIAIN